MDRRHGIVALLILLFACGCQRSGQPAPPPPGGATSTRTDTARGAEDPAGDAADVIRVYYAAIKNRRYPDAYRCWGSDGAASGKSLEAFRDGFANTAAVAVAIGTPGPVEGAAGSRYVEIPVRIIASARDGTRQRFSGKYTLRRSVVDGATPELRAWRIYSAKIRRER